MREQLDPALGARLSEWIAGRLGLHFPSERQADLQRGLADAAHEFGFDDTSQCAAWLLTSAPSAARLEVLASHLTIGESYFFRDPKTLEAMAGTVLPALAGARREGVRRLRVWSAGCSTGEEAYTLAILLHEALPDIADWQVTVCATDINPRALGKAAEGVYGEWSFRDVPARIRQQYFIRGADGRFAIHPRIRKLVRFSRLNLVDPACASFVPEGDGFDVIFCRNVLMYFTPAQAARAVAHLHQALGAGGWLAVSPSEASQAMLPQFEPVNFPGAILFRKHPPHVPEPAKPAAAFAQPSASSPPQTVDPVAYLNLARAMANQGQLEQALVWCDLWLATDRLHAPAHYLRAVILMEQDKPELARASLLRAVYLEPGLVLAHVGLGNLARDRGQQREAGKHFTNAQRLLGRYRPGDPVPESDGLTAGRLAQTLASMTPLESTP